MNKVNANIGIIVGNRVMMGGLSNLGLGIAPFYMKKLRKRYGNETNRTEPQPKGSEPLSRAEKDALWQQRISTYGELRTVENKTTRIKGLTIEKCVIAIHVKQGVHVAFENLVIRRGTTGIYVSPGAAGAVLAIRRSHFMEMSNAIFSQAADLSVRVIKTVVAMTGPSFHPIVSIAFANRYGADRFLTLEELQQHIRSSFGPARVHWESDYTNRSAGLYFVGRGSDVQIVDARFCNNEYEAILVTGPSSRLAVEESRFSAACSKDDVAESGRRPSGAAS